MQAAHWASPSAARRALVAACGNSCAMCVNHARRGLISRTNSIACSTVWCIGCGVSAQRVEDQIVEVRQKRFGRIRNAAEIGEIGSAAETKSQHGQIPVFHGHGRKRHAHQLEWPVNRVQLHKRNRRARQARHRRRRKKFVARYPAWQSELYTGIAIFCFMLKGRISSNPWI